MEKHVIKQPFPFLNQNIWSNWNLWASKSETTPQNIFKWHSRNFRTVVSGSSPPRPISRIKIPETWEWTRNGRFVPSRHLLNLLLLPGPQGPYILHRKLDFTAVVGHKVQVFITSGVQCGTNSFLCLAQLFCFFITSWAVCLGVN